MARHANGHFQKGTGGRPAGSRNKLQAKVLDSILKDWEANGEATLRIVRMEKPDIWLRVVASLLPKEIQLTDNEVSDLSDDDVKLFLEHIRRLKDAAPRLIDARTEN